jgi:DNA polymerase-4
VTDPGAGQGAGDGRERRSGPPEPGILHVDMDAFFVSVELIDHPELRGRPVIVGGAGDRGVVAAASYEARAYGVHSAMSSVRARRLCPHAVFLAGRHDRYAHVSREVMAIFESFTPLVEPLSLDEAFLDVTGSERLHGRPTEVADAIRRRVLDEVSLTCSVGVAPSKFVAKLASEAAKPRASVSGPQPGLGVKVVREGEVQDFLFPLPVRALWGVGPATLERQSRLGVTTVGELADLPLEVVTSALGNAVGRHLHALANGVDDRAVEPDRPIKSVGHEETFARDHHTHASLEREIVRLSDSVGARLRRHGLAGRTLTLKVRFSDFHTITRSSTFAGATDSTAAITRGAKDLLAAVDPTPGVRLIGVSMSGLSDASTRQLTLDDVGAPGWDDAIQAVDAIRERFGATSIGPATLADPDGLHVRREAQAPWGPGQSDPWGPGPSDPWGPGPDRRGPAQGGSSS